MNSKATFEGLRRTLYHPTREQRDASKGNQYNQRSKLRGEERREGNQAQPTYRDAQSVYVEDLWTEVPRD